MATFFPTRIFETALPGTTFPLKGISSIIPPVTLNVIPVKGESAPRLTLAINPVDFDIADPDTRASGNGLTLYLYVPNACLSESLKNGLL